MHVFGIDQCFDEEDREEWRNISTYEWTSLKGTDYWSLKLIMLITERFTSAHGVSKTIQICYTVSKFNHSK